MPHDVFISYSSHDKAVADATCAALEAQEIRCWIAPRDVLAGTEYGEAIVSAIENCRAVVLVFSAHANESPHIRREVERAVSKGKFIVPFRIENVMPSRALEYCLGNTHWLDALTPPLEARIGELVGSVASLLNHEPVVSDKHEGNITGSTPAKDSSHFERAGNDYLDGDIIASAIVGREHAQTALKKLVTACPKSKASSRTEQRDEIVRCFSTEIARLREKYATGGTTDQTRLDACLAGTVAKYLEQELANFEWNIEEDSGSRRWRYCARLSGRLFGLLDKSASR